jgi:hypothetical protein
MIANRMYRTLDFIFPALVAAVGHHAGRVGFRGADNGSARPSAAARLTRIISGMPSRVPYLVIDLRENGLAQALFSDASLASDVPPGVTALLSAFTAWKFATLGAAVLIVIAIWFRVWMRSRKA